MGNSLQKNPSDPTEDFVQPDWNSAAGTGVEPATDDAVDFSEAYASMRETAKSEGHVLKSTI